MVNPDLELARRAVACKHWRWMPGMVAGGGGRRVRSKRTGGPPYKGAIPDLTDPATLGCLLALVREACGDPWIRVEPGSRGWYCIHSRPPAGGGIPGNGETEAAALVAALEAAP